MQFPQPSQSTNAFRISRIVGPQRHDCLGFWPFMITITILSLIIVFEPQWMLKDYVPSSILWIFTAACYLCALILIFLRAIGSIGTDRSNENRDSTSDSEATTHSTPRVTRTVMAPRGQYSHGTLLELPYGSNLKAARLAMRALPPVKSFADDDNQTIKSNCECPICLEEFKVGELIQPFGFCDHQFHSSCLYSWLHSGNSTTCPVCRTELAFFIGTEEANQGEGDMRLHVMVQPQQNGIL